MADKIQIKTEFIKLDQLLKLCGMVSTGGEAKSAVTAGFVSVNGETCVMRGKKLRPGDKIFFNGREVELTGGEHPQ